MATTRATMRCRRCCASKTEHRGRPCSVWTTPSTIRSAPAAWWSPSRRSRASVSANRDRMRESTIAGRPHDVGRPVSGHHGSYRRETLMATLTMSKNRAGAYALALLIAGCSSSSSPSSQNGDSGAVADTGAVSQSEGSTTGDGGNVCAAIVADVQALVVPAIASLQNTVDGCIPLLAGDGGQLDMQVLYGADA